MLQVTNYVMRFAPFAVFTAVTSAIAEQGPEIIATFGKFVGSFYLGLIILWALLIGACFVIVGPRTRHLVRYIRDPVVLAFSTASSEAAYPRTLEALDRFGVPPRIASFVLPLGYSFNLDGSMMYMTFATIFIAQAYGIDLSLGQEITMLLVLMITSEGHGGRAAREPRRDRRDHVDVPHSRSRPAADPRRRPFPRHGPLGDERRR